jgi:hypothetical protein
MKDFSVRQVLRMLARTAPFLVFRFLIYFGITLTYFVATGAGAGIGMRRRRFELIAALGAAPTCPGRLYNAPLSHHQAYQFPWLSTSTP